MTEWANSEGHKRQADESTANEDTHVLLGAWVWDKSNMRFRHVTVVDVTTRTFDGWITIKGRLVENQDLIRTLDGIKTNLSSRRYWFGSGGFVVEYAPPQ